MWLCISSLQIDDFKRLSSGITTGWCRCNSRQWWLRLWSHLHSHLCPSVSWRYSCPIECPGCLWIVCSAILARKASGHMVLTKHSRVSFHPSLLLSISRKLNTLHLLFPDLGMRFLDQVLYLLYCGTRKCIFGHSGHIQGQAHVGLFQLYPISLPCHRSRHVEYQQKISCWFKYWDPAITSITYTPVLSSEVVEGCFFHLQVCLSWISSGKGLERTTSWCLILRPVQPNSLVDHWDFPLRAAITWSNSS